MASKDFTYDPGKKLAANKIVGEEVPFDPSVTIAVIPENHPFFLTSLVLEGQKSDNSWVTLNISTDYFVSPDFLQASGAIGEPIISYFVVLRKDIQKLKFSYHCLGQYENTTLLALIANREFDRTDPIEWGKIQGDAASFAPMVRDPNVIDRSLAEIQNIGLEKLRLAIANPHSGDSISATDVTDIFIQLGLTATKEDLKKIHTFPTDVQFVEQGIEREVSRFISDNRYVSGEVIFKAADGNLESRQFTCILVSDKPDFQQFARLRSTPETMFNMDIRLYGTDYRITATPDRDGDFVVKLHSLFM